MQRIYRAAALVCLLAVGPPLAPAQVTIDSGVFGALQARPLGPAVTSGRIAAIDGVARDARTLYVGAANGGVWKTTNGGTTFKPVFDRHTQSIGAIAVDQSRPDTVWVGTGEPWTRNSTSVGTGVYKTPDAGDNWQFLGLANSERIAKIVIDPKNSSTVYVAALGALWSASEERGVYKTTDAGKSWQRILYVDADTGCSDLAIDPQEPSILYAGMWQFRRQPWTFRSGGPGSGLYRSADGGKSWQRLQEGLPEGELGRVAVAVAPSRPSVVYALIESKKSALYRSDDTGRTWHGVNESSTMGERPFYFSLLVVDPKDYNLVYKPGFLLNVSRDGGKVFTPVGLGPTSFGFHPDVHALWIDPANTATLYLGTDGGVFRSHDGGGAWHFLRNLPVSQFYHVSYDMERPYNVFGGLQDNGSWSAPSQGRGGVQNRDWTNVGIGDGFYVFAHPADRNILYSQYQGGKLLRFHKSTGEIKSIQPHARAGDPKLRFNWNAAVALSPTDPDALYIGAQFLFRSRDKGESWERLSPDLTTNDPEKQKQQESGGLTTDNSTAENHCTIVAIAESPLDAKVIWAGADDGNVQVTRDGGKTWANAAAGIPGLPRHTWVSSIEASRYDRGTAYATFDGHMTGDMKTYVYRTADFGKSWTSLVTPELKGFAHVVREDRVKPDLLFVGTEFGLFLTIDGGRQWAQFTGNLPGVAVRDLAIHPREHDLIVATHGRGAYVVDDITPLRQLTPEVLNSRLAVIEGRPSPVRLPALVQGFGGQDEFAASNPPEAAYVTYYLKERHMLGDFRVQVYDAENNLVTTLPAGTRRGINRVPWPMRLRPPRVPRAPSMEASSLIGPVAPEGTYTAKIQRGEETYTARIQLVGDPSSPHPEKDRKLQQATVMKLYRMIERLAFVSAAAVEARDQAGDRAKPLQPDEELAKSLDAFREKLDALNKTLVAMRGGGGMAGPITGEVRLREQIGELYGEVSRYGGRPTQSQTERSAFLEQEVDRANRSFESLSAERESLNAKLSARQLQPIAKLTPEQYEKRQPR